MGPPHKGLQGGPPQPRPKPGHCNPPKIKVGPITPKRWVNTSPNKDCPPLGPKRGFLTPNKPELSPNVQPKEGGINQRSGSPFLGKNLGESSFPNPRVRVIRPHSPRNTHRLFQAMQRGVHFGRKIAIIGRLYGRGILEG